MISKAGYWIMKSVCVCVVYFLNLVGVGGQIRKLENFDDLSGGGKVCNIDEQFVPYGTSIKHEILLNYRDSVGNIANYSHRNSKKTCLRGPIYKGCWERENYSERNMLYV